MGDATHPGVTLREELLRQNMAMVHHLVGRGLQIPEDLAVATGAVDENAGDIRTADLIRVHERLAALASPATPAGVLTLQEERDNPSRLSMLGAVPLARHLTICSVVFLVAFLGLALSPDVNHNPESADLFGSSGGPLLVNVLFLLAAAGLGATFAALFKLNTEIARVTYDRTSDSSYWMLLVLGVISGIFLAELLTEVGDGGIGGIARPLLAVLGGFSVGLVHRLLTRLVETVEQLFEGSSQELVEREQQLARTRTLQAVSSERLALAAQLLAAQRTTAGGADADTLDKVLSPFIEELLGRDRVVDLRPASRTGGHDTRPNESTVAPATDTATNGADPGKVGDTVSESGGG